MISEISQPASADIRPTRDSFAWTHCVSSASHWRDQRSTQGLSTGYQAWDLTRECSTQGPRWKLNRCRLGLSGYDLS